MQINISARHGTISEATREKITKKVEKLERFHDRVTAIDVTVDLEPRENPVLDVQIHTEPKHEFVVKTQAGELFISLDDAIHKLEQQLKKHKEKIISAHRGE